MFTRFSGNVAPFASNSTSTNRTIFGSITQSDAIDDNLNSDFLLGWEIVGVNDNPTKQDFNAMGFTLGSLIAYLYQQGLPSWNTNQEYYIGGYSVGSDNKIYRSITGTVGTPNTGNDPVTDGGTNWVWILEGFVDLTTAQDIGGVKNFLSFPTTPSSAPTTDYQVANKKYVDDTAVGFLSEIGKSLTASGYMQFSNGLIIQWGFATTVGGTTSYPISFPITFPNGVLQAVANRTYVTGAAIYQPYVQSYTTTQITIYSANVPAGDVTYIAIGW